MEVNDSLSTGSWVLDLASLAGWESAATTGHGAQGCRVGSGCAAFSWNDQQLIEEGRNKNGAIIFSQFYYMQHKVQG